VHQLQHRDLVIDLNDHRVRLRSREVRLTPTEFRLLVFFVERSGQLVTHRQVLTGVWGAGYGTDVHLLRMTIRNLRAKLKAVTPGESWIATEYGLGYRLTGPSEPVAERT
jgi:two-component system, OmpR family, KDP operon response regulator KdpE